MLKYILGRYSYLAVSYMKISMTLELSALTASYKQLFIQFYKVILVECSRGKKGNCKIIDILLFQFC